MSAPPVAHNFELDRFLGEWFIAVTNYGYWKERTDCKVRYEKLPSGEIKDTLSFRKDGRPDTLGGVDRQDAVTRQHFVWRGNGLFWLVRSPWWVVKVADDYSWAVTYFGRSNVGTPAGMDIYSRAPSLDPKLTKQIVDELRPDPFMGPHVETLFATLQDGVADEHYRGCF